MYKFMVLNGGMYDMIKKIKHYVNEKSVCKELV